MKKGINYQEKINKLTQEINEKYPELYQHLGENPITIPSRGEGEFGKSHLKDYYESLKELIENHIETH